MIEDGEFEQEKQVLEQRVPAVWSFAFNWLPGILYQPADEPDWLKHNPGLQQQVRKQKLFG